MHIDDIFRQIDALPGMEDFKALCRRLQTAAGNAVLPSQIPLPNLIFAAAPGCGTSLHIHLLTQLLKALRLMTFTGEEECFEWALANKEPNFDRFLQRVKSAGGFYGQFRGVIGLDISVLLEESDDYQTMPRLMEYVEARQGKILFVFIVPEDTSERTLRQLVGSFASITPVELVRMPFPADTAHRYVTDQLKSRGYRLTRDAAARLKDAISKLSANEEFEGYQTLLNLTDEIIWHKLSRTAAAGDAITVADLAFLAGQDGYCSRFSAYAHRKRVVGFGGLMED